jgi:D-alanyl-lipoteichoic acid acyltransferase DltB (MBOAT superfamily)
MLATISASRMYDIPPARMPSRMFMRLTQSDHSVKRQEARGCLPTVRHILYTFRNYLAYVLYAPLYIAGQIVTFMWQVRMT